MEGHETDVNEVVSEAMQCMDRREFETALGLLEQALSIRDDDPDLWNYMGVALRSVGRYDEANKCFEKSLNLDPRDRASS